jgi:HD-like signal output (HDOD) protein
VESENLPPRLNPTPQFDLGRFLESLHGKCLAPVQSQVLKVCSSASASLAEIEEQIRNDPVLTAAIMSQAQRSPIRRRSPRRLSEALNALGLASIRETVQEQDTFDLSNGLLECTVRAQAHALFCASWMERFCPTLPAAFLVGLCHDLPETLLMQHMGPEEWDALQKTAAAREQSLFQAIEELIGIPYREFANAVFRRLDLPEAILAPILEHASAFLSSAPTMASREAARLEMANQWACSFLLASTPYVPLSIPPREETALRLQTRAITEITEIAENSWAAALRSTESLTAPPGAFQIPSPESRPRLTLLHEDRSLAQSPLERLFSNWAHLSVVANLERFDEKERDAVVFIGNRPERLFPEGFPYDIPLLVLHKQPPEQCQFPKAQKLETLRLPSTLHQISQLLQRY